MKSRFLLVLTTFAFGLICKPVDVYNPGIPFSSAWWETTALQCVLGELEACVPGPKINGSLDTKYVSSNPGALNSANLTWTSDSPGPYSILLAAADCSTGTVLASGTAIANSPNSQSILSTDVNFGANDIRICVTDAGDGDVGFAIFRIYRDETPPSVSSSPTTGSYSSAQNVSLVCSDALAGCDKIAYVTDTSTPDIDGTTGTINVGTQYATPISVPVQTSTTFKFQARDKAGNLSAVNSSTVTSDSIAPTTSSISPSNGATGVSPSPGSIVLNFAEPMDSSITTTMTTEVNNGTGWVTVPNTKTQFSWSGSPPTNSDTLVITISWIYFPENSQIRWTIPSSALKDLAGNGVTVQGTFTTTTGGAVTGSQSYSGPTQHGTYTSDYTTYDIVTSLTWKTCWESRTAPACSGAATSLPWAQALDACAYLNDIHGPGVGYYARANWRLPNVRELQTLVEGSANPFINTVAFPNPLSFATWTSTGGDTAFTPVEKGAYTVVFMYGSTSEFDKTSTYGIHCVSD